MIEDPAPETISAPNLVADALELAAAAGLISPATETVATANVTASSILMLLDMAHLLKR
jgi:hypothetical protein